MCPNLENECWVCNTPFDESSALKAVKKPEDAVAVDIEDEIVVDTGKSPQKLPHKDIKRGEYVDIIFGNFLIDPSNLCQKL